MEMIQKEKVKLTAKVVSQEALTDDICSMWIQADAIAKRQSRASLSLYTRRIRARCFRVPSAFVRWIRSRADCASYTGVVGAGTREFSAYQAGDDIEIMGPLGNGFPVKREKGFLIGGGIGIPPMLELAKNLNCEKQMVLGYRDVLFLKQRI